MKKLIEHFTPASAAVAFAHPAQVKSRVHTILQADRRRTGVTVRSAIPFVLAAFYIAPLGTLHVIAQQAPTRHAKPVRKSISHPSSAAQPVRAKQAVASGQPHAAVAQSIRLAGVHKTASAPVLDVSINKTVPSINKLTTHAGQMENFPDVPKSHWAYQAVLELKQKGILIGYPPAR